MSRITRAAAVAASSAILAATAAVGSAVPAQAASCTFSQDTWATYNKTCTLARHFNNVRQSGKLVSKYAPWVGKYRTSTNWVCYANNVSHGTQVRV